MTTKLLTDAEKVQIYKDAAPFLALLASSLPPAYPALNNPNADRHIWWNASRHSLVDHHLQEAKRLGVTVPSADELLF